VQRQLDMCLQINEGVASKPFGLELLQVDSHKSGVKKVTSSWDTRLPLNDVAQIAQVRRVPAWNRQDDPDRRDITFKRQSAIRQ